LFINLFGRHQGRAEKSERYKKNRGPTFFIIFLTRSGLGTDKKNDAKNLGAKTEGWVAKNYLLAMISA
jgi:hypothetical protein